MMQTVPICIEMTMQLPDLMTAEELRQLVARDPSVSELYALTRTQCYFLLSKEVVNLLALFLKSRKTIEVGAGNGFLAAHLRREGVMHYEAYDNLSSHYTNADINYGVIHHDARELELRHYDVVVMTWPPCNKPFAKDIIDKMQAGQYLVYQGEHYGCTADRSFEETLTERFVPVPVLTYSLNKHHVTYGDYRDEWSVLKKVK